MILEDEILEPLEKINKKIIQKKDGYRFSMDPILLVNFLNIRKDSIIADFGTGSAIMPILLSNRKKLKKIYGYEIQDNISDMAQRSIILNQLSNKIKIINKDIKKINKKFDIIISNPPYMKTDTGKISTNIQKAISRSELKVNLSELIKKAGDCLNSGGSFNIIYRTKRFEELLSNLDDNDFITHRIRFIRTKKNKNANLFMLEAIKNKDLGLNIIPELIIYDDNNKYVKEVQNYYR
ncbi:MAG: tRNA1(Val) (adenine(37)-N6)-methyltransferase [Fusobacteriota bacterium]